MGYYYLLPPLLRIRNCISMEFLCRNILELWHYSCTK